MIIVETMILLEDYDLEKSNELFYDAITNFSNTYGYHKFNDEVNHYAYMKLVDMSITFGKIPEANRNEFSTHGLLNAAITYDSDRERFCSL